MPILSVLSGQKSNCKTDQFPAKFPPNSGQIPAKNEVNSTLSRAGNTIKNRVRSLEWVQSTYYEELRNDFIRHWKYITQIGHKLEGESIYISNAPVAKRFRVFELGLESEESLLS